VNVLSTISRVFVVLAIAGLVLAPLARPAMAMPSQMQGTMSEHSAIDTQMGMAMPADMPCCSDEAPASDCAKDCPLMALCMVGVMQSGPLAAALFISLGLAGVVIPVNDADLSGLAQAPPPRPPKVQV